MYLLTKTFVYRDKHTTINIVGYTDTISEAYAYADRQNHINTKKVYYKNSIRYTFKSLTAKYHQIVYEWKEIPKITI